MSEARRKALELAVERGSNLLSHDDVIALAGRYYRFLVFQREEPKKPEKTRKGKKSGKGKK